MQYAPIIADLQSLQYFGRHAENAAVTTPSPRRIKAYSVSALHQHRKRTAEFRVAGADPGRRMMRAAKRDQAVNPQTETTQTSGM